MGRTKRVLLMCLGLTALATVATVAAVAPGVAGRYVSRAPTPAEPTDEQVVRQVWQVPAHVPCKALDADPKAGGFYGREGLRIVATYEFFTGGLSSYRKTFRPDEWRPLPLPAKVTGIHRGAAELAGIQEGFYLCLVDPTGWSPAGGAKAPDPSSWVSLDNPAAPKGCYRHSIAVLDTARQRLVIVCQNHY